MQPWCFIILSYFCFLFHVLFPLVCKVLYRTEIQMEDMAAIGTFQRLPAWLGLASSPPLPVASRAHSSSSVSQLEWIILYTGRQGLSDTSLRETGLFWDAGKVQNPVNSEAQTGKQRERIWFYQPASDGSRWSWQQAVELRLRDSWEKVHIKHFKMLHLLLICLHLCFVAVLLGNCSAGVKGGYSFPRQQAFFPPHMHFFAVPFGKCSAGEARNLICSATRFFSPQMCRFSLFPPTNVALQELSKAA